MRRLPLLHFRDHRELARYLPGICCPGCDADNRRHFSAVVVCSILGISLSDAKNLKWRWATDQWRQRLSRAGVFERLQREQVLAPLVNWQHVDSGRYVNSNHFTARQPLERIIHTFRPVIEQEMLQRRRELAEAAGGAGDGLAVRDLSVGELRNLSAAAKRLMRSRARRGCGGGADAMAEVGEDRYVESLNRIAARPDEECVRLAHRSPDPEVRLDTWLTDHRIPRAKLVSVPRAWLQVGQRFKVYGVPAIIADPSTLRIDNDEFELESLERVPADFIGLIMPRVLPRLGEDPPF